MGRLELTRPARKHEEAEVKALFQLTCGLVFVWAVILAPGNALAQGYGTISGRVTDPTGAVVPEAAVTATQAGTGVVLQTTTNGDGAYVFPSLAPSLYNLSASHPGFRAYSEQGLQVRADAALTANITLQTGSTTETVTVNANAAQVDVTTGTLSQVIGTSQVNNLPLNGRNAASLTTLVAGVALAPYAQADQGNTKTFPEVVTITANGTFVGQTNYMLDGGNNMDEYTNVNFPFPMPDALQEFSVQTSNYAAEYGQNAGGIVNIVTKSGTSKYHGDLFEFVRNGDLNAANYFSYVNGVKTVDPLKRNQFGGTFGGPVAIPGLFHTDKAFFFVGYQKTINRDVALSSTAATLPTTAQQNGTFANETKCIVNPLQPTHVYPCTKVGNTFTTQVNTADYSPASLKLLTYLPPASQLNANGTIQFRAPNDYDLSEVTARFDQELTPKDRLTARYFSDEYSLDGVLNLQNLLTYADQAQNNYYNALISESHTFNDHILNNFILSYQLDLDKRGPLPGSIDVNDLGVNIWQPAFKQINSIAATGYFSIGGNPQAFFDRANYTLADDVHWQLGNHNLAFGFHGEIAKMDINNLYRQPGNFTFNANNTGDAIASYLLGYVYEFSQASGQFYNARNKFYGAYAQDSWRATRKLTLDYGVRYEPFIPWREIAGRMGSFFPSLWAAGEHSAVYPNAPAGLRFAGDTGFNRNGIDSEYDHFMPRVGFAWDVYGTGRTSLRGGAGMFYDTRISSALFNLYTNTSPFITNVDVTNANGAAISFTNPYGSYGTPNPFPAPQPPPSSAAIPPQSFLTFDPFHGFQDPVTYQWNLALEQQLSSSLSTRLAYVGGHGNHQWVPIELNPFISGTRIYDHPGCSTGNSCYTQTITEINTGANTNYNALQLSVEQRVRYGLTLLANYTWSKALDNRPYNASSTSVAAGNSYVYPITMANFKRLDYGPSDFDHRNVVSMSYVYAIPRFADGSPAGVRYLVNGWETTGIFAFRSGDPLTIISNSANNSGSGQQRDRAVQVGYPYGGSACHAGSICKSYLNPASFTNNPVGTYGTVTKGSFVGPQYADWDVSVARRFSITERANLQFRAEYFNVLNHTNFGDPNTTNNSTFGQITSTTPQNSVITNDPRIAQLSLKLIF
jgi:Carboxypeptidase regulatory-like domain